MFSSLVLACMAYACGIFCHDLSLAWRISWIYSGFISLSICWIAMEIMGLLPYFVLVGSNVSLAWVELLVPGFLVGQTLWSPVKSWVELLVP